MRSEARSRLSLNFSAVDIGQQFHLVNTVMGAALPGTPAYSRIADVIDEDGYVQFNAISVQGERVRIRSDQPVELVPGQNRIN